MNVLALLLLLLKVFLLLVRTTTATSKTICAGTKYTCFSNAKRLQPYITLLSHIVSRQPLCPHKLTYLRVVGHRPRCGCIPHLNLTMSPPRSLRASGASACALVFLSGCDNAAVVDGVHSAAPAFVSSTSSFNEAASSGQAAPLSAAAVAPALALALPNPSQDSSSTRRGVERWGRSRQLLFASAVGGAPSPPTTACSRSAMGEWGRRACFPLASFATQATTTQRGPNMSKLVSFVCCVGFAQLVLVQTILVVTLLISVCTYNSCFCGEVLGIGADVDAV